MLCYISNEDKRFKTFVSNRVSKIRAHSLSGLTANELVSFERSIHEPSCLWNEEYNWPTQTDFFYRYVQTQSFSEIVEPTFHLVQDEKALSLILGTENDFAGKSVTK